MGDSGLELGLALGSVAVIGCFSRQQGNKAKEGTCTAIPSVDEGVSGQYLCMGGLECTELDEYTDARDCTAISSSKELSETGLCAPELTAWCPIGRHRGQCERMTGHPDLWVTSP